MMVLGDGEVLDESLLPPAVRLGAPPGSHFSEPAPLRDTHSANGSRGSDGSPISLPTSGVVLEDLEADLIRQALRRTGGKLEPAAQLLGITYKTLQYRIKKYALKERAGHLENGLAA
jgi:DNA-binding NtrC family response regulator